MGCLTCSLYGCVKLKIEISNVKHTVRPILGLKARGIGRTVPGCCAGKESASADTTRGDDSSPAWRHGAFSSFASKNFHLEIYTLNFFLPSELPFCMYPRLVCEHLRLRVFPILVSFSIHIAVHRRRDWLVTPCIRPRTHGGWLSWVDLDCAISLFAKSQVLITKSYSTV